MTLDTIKTAIGIEPYYEEPAGMIYCADCLDILPKIPEKSIDLVLTDPPYGISGQNKSQFTSSSGLRKLDFGDWDNKYPYDVWQIITPILQNNSNVVSFLDAKMITKLWAVFEAQGYRPKQSIYWHKRRVTINPRRNFASSIEVMLWAARGNYTWNGGGVTPNIYVENICELNYPPNVFHPTQKPQELIRWLIGLFSIDRQLIIDPYAGSFTTCVAAKQLGRKFIGIEIDEKYCEIAKQRLAQDELFNRGME